jgi:hypothetical protein
MTSPRNPDASGDGKKSDYGLWHELDAVGRDNLQGWNIKTR